MGCVESMIRVGERTMPKTMVILPTYNEKENLPLMIESPVSVGSVKVVLKSYKGLKYNLDSKKD